LKVFISSTSEDLEPHRLAAMDVIRDAQWEPIGMEHFPADPRPIVQLCQEEIQKCGLVILLQAWRYGWVASSEQRGDGHTSATAFEIAAADAAQRPVLAFLADSNWPGILWDDDPTARVRVKDFRGGLNRNVKFFKWEDDPNLPLFRALLREGLANYRMRETGPPPTPRPDATESVEAVRDVLAGCYRRSVFTRTHAQLSIDSMFESITECRRLVQSKLPKVAVAELAQPIANILSALDGIERIHVRANSPESADNAAIDGLKLEALRNLRLLSKATGLPYAIPDNLTEEVFFSKQDADKPPTVGR
jgi:hypothetical protein